MLLGLATGLFLYMLTHHSVAALGGFIIVSLMARKK